MSAEILREAARVLRDRAQAAERVSVLTKPAMKDLRFGDYNAALIPAEFDYITTVQDPGVGLALADLLDEAASGYLIESGYASDHLLTIARKILGGAS